MTISPVKKLIFSGLCVALGIVLPITLHSIPNAGSIFLPIHIPVLLCGLACGWQYGLACGILTPLLSGLLTGMPPAAFLPAMICELAVYGLLTGIMRGIIKTKHVYIGLYVQLITAMFAGRIVYGIMNAVLFQAGAYSFQVWVSAVFVTSLPGIAIQLVLIPLLIIALRKARLIDYAKQ